MEGFARHRITRHLRQPTAPGFIVDTAGRPGLLACDLHLISMYAARFVGPFVLALVLRQYCGLRLVAVAPDLHARIERRIVLHFKLQNEVAVLFFGAQKGIGTAGCGYANQFAFFDEIPGSAIALAPAVKRLAVENRRELLRRAGHGYSERCEHDACAQ
jgi:hypothetical protein